MNVPHKNGFVDGLLKAGPVWLDLAKKVRVKPPSNASLFEKKTDFSAHG
jgi:hypothetical protein